MPNSRLIATTVVRGSQQGESHGGVVLVDLESQHVSQAIDWKTRDIDWRGHGGDRGLRGIAIHEETVFIAASDELHAYTPDFQLIGSWRNPYLKHCHGIDVWDGSVFLTSSGFDSILAFDIAKRTFHWALYVESEQHQYKGQVFDPNGDEGPLMLDKLQLNSIACRKEGMYLCGQKTGGMVHFNGEQLRMAVQLPAGIHDAQPFRDGVLFNDTEANALRYCGRGEGTEDRAMKVPVYEDGDLTNTRGDDNHGARQGFARGLCALTERVVVGGSSPSTVTVYDLRANRQLLSVRLSRDVRSSIHGLEVWPY